MMRGQRVNVRDGMSSQSGVLRLRPLAVTFQQRHDGDNTRANPVHGKFWRGTPEAERDTRQVEGGCVVHSHDVSDDAEGSGRVWRKSSRSYGTGECVEIAPSGTRIDVRDSTDISGAVLTFSSTQWNAFIANVRSEASVS
jgi:hypothetical protein